MFQMTSFRFNTYDEKQSRPYDKVIYRNDRIYTDFKIIK
jgi:hypothetical protein